MSLSSLARLLTRSKGLYSWPVNALTRPVTRHALHSAASIAYCPSGLYRHQRDVSIYNRLLALPGCGGVYCKYASTNAELLETVNAEAMSQQQNKIFGVVHISGRQFKITANDLIVVNQIEADIGSEINLKKVLLVGTENFTLIGQPILSNEVVKVKATVVEHNKTAKVIVFKKKRRKNYKRTRGHRQPISVLRINSLEFSSALK